MNRGAGRRLVFRSAAQRAVFLHLLGDVSRIYGIEAHAYCLMGNHYHLLLCTPTAGLGRAMRHLNGVYTQRFNHTERTDGPLFRGRYKSVLIQDDSHLCCVSRYIHLNPLEANLVSRPEEYGASSYRAYVGLDDSPWWLHTGETLRRLAPGNSRESYRRFVEAGIDDETRAFYAKTRLRPVLGSEDFREKMEQRVQAAGIGSDPERPDCRTLTDRPAFDAIAAAICRAFEVSMTDLRETSRRRRGFGTVRGAFVQLGREAGGQSLGAIASWVGYRSYAGASKAMIRFRATAIRVRDVRDRVEVARRELTNRRRS